MGMVAFVNAHADEIKKGLGAVVAVFGVLKAVPKLAGAAQKYLDRRFLVKKLGAKKYTSEQILAATTHYIVPDCQNVDPTGAEDWRFVHHLRKNAFDTLDGLFWGQAQFRHTILLADSGMGKTSLLLNYYVRHTRRWYAPFELAVVPLGASNADDLISEVKNKDKTVLLLDAFDEDARAIDDHRARLEHLIGIAADFKHILITCRSQFFKAENEIPQTVAGEVRFDPVGGSREYVFNKLYLSPLSDKQVRAYLRSRFPLWRLAERRRASKLCASVGDLPARPMLLANLGYVLAGNRPVLFPVQIYEAMLDRWIERERPYVRDGESLMRFSRAVARDIFCNRANRSGEYIPYDSIIHIARDKGISLKGWQLSGRSLLVRTLDDKLKFAHRSILEYLFVQDFLQSPHGGGLPWTDQMGDFFWQSVITSPSPGVSMSHFDRAKYLQGGPPLVMDWISEAQNKIGETALQSVFYELNTLTTIELKFPIGQQTVQSKVTEKSAICIRFVQDGEEFLKVLACQDMVSGVVVVPFTKIEGEAMPLLTDSVKLMLPDKLVWVEGVYANMPGFRFCVAADKSTVLPPEWYRATLVARCMKVLRARPKLLDLGNSGS